VQIPTLIPENHVLKIHENKATLSFVVSESLPDIKDHFPEVRLVAGYYQFIWINYLIDKTFKNKYISQIIDTKYKEKIVPGDEISISLEWSFERATKDQLINFKITTKDSVTRSQGKLKIDSPK